MKNPSIPGMVAVAFLLVGMPVVATASSAASPPAQSFTASLSAVPGVSTSATGEATFQLSPDGQSINYTLTVLNIKNVFMAHIHLSPNADILLWLYPNPNALLSGRGGACSAAMSGGPVSSCPALISGTFSGILAQGTITAADLNGSSTCPGCSGLSPRTIPALIAEMQSGQTYVLAHTERNTAGEVRGTITAVGSHALTITPAASAVGGPNTFGISAAEFYAVAGLAVAGLAVVFMIAAGFFVARARSPSS